MSSSPQGAVDPARRREVFAAALQVTGATERAAFLDQACAGDTELRTEVESLLLEEAELGAFLETPALVGWGAEEREAAGLLSGDEVPGLDEVRLGDRIGRYRLIEKIGEGGAGAVYMAEQEEPVRRHVALKIIKLGMDTRNVVARFEAERQALALMDHPNIATALDAGATQTGRPYFVMELVRGVRITEYCDRNRLTVQERLALFVQVCHAIQHAHQKGVIHRDIKPSNILVTVLDGAPVPKVIDFGIAKATEHRLTEKTLFTAFTAFIGTPAYMSPEQAEMSGLDIDTRSDVYSLGVLLYELLTGTPPFDARALIDSGLDACRHTIREVDPVRPSARLATLAASAPPEMTRQRGLDATQLVPLLRGDLDWVVMKCLEKDRQRRYATASELALDLQRYLTNEPVLARPPSRAYRFRKFVRRNRGMLAAAGGVSLALIAGTAVSTWQAVRAIHAEHDALAAQAQEEQLRREAERQRAAARLNEYIADINLAHQSLLAGNVGRAFQLVNKHGSAAGSPDLRGFEWRYLWRRCQGDEHLSLPIEEESVQCLSVSADGRWLVVGLRNACTVWDLERRTQLRRIAHGGLTAAFLDPGPRLAVAGPQSLRILNPLTGTEDRVLEGVGAPFAVSPDSKFIAASTRGGMALLDVSQGSVVRRFPGASAPAAFSAQGDLLATSSRDGLRLWDLESGKTPRDLPDSRDRFFLGGWWFGGSTLMAFTPDGEFLVSPRSPAAGLSPFALSLWNVASGEERVMPADPERVEHSGLVTSLAITPDGRTLVTASMDHSIRLWDLASQRRTAVLRGHRNEVWAVTVTPDGRSVISGGKDGAVKIWSTARRESREVPSGGGIPLAFSADGSLLAVWTNGQALRLLDAATGQVRSEIPLTPVSGLFRPTLALTRDFSNVAETRRDGSVLIRDLNRDVSKELPGDGRPVWFVCISPDVRTVVTGAPGFRARGWNVETLERWEFETEAHLATFSPDGNRIAFGVRSGSVHLVEPLTRRLHLRLQGSLDSLSGVVYSPDGALLATCGAAGPDHILEVWETRTGKRVNEFRGHKQGVRAVAFSPDAVTLASAGDDGTLRFWNVATGQELLSLPSAPGPAQELLFSPDGSVLVLSSFRAPQGASFTAVRAPSLEEIAASPPP